MFELDALNFVEAIEKITSLNTLAATLLKQKTAGITMSGGEYGDFKMAIDKLEKLINKIGLPVSSLCLRDFIDFLENREVNEADVKLRVPDKDLSTMSVWISDVAKTVKRELSSRLLLSMPLAKINYYQPDEPLFGKDFSNNFQSASYELDEAAKCFALNRHTACVFHLMRIMEIGINAARKSLSIPDPVKPSERNWGKILQLFKVEIDARNKTPSKWVKSSNVDFFSEVYVSLDAVRNVWRNATMHVEKTYTEEEAERIYLAVKGFMKKMSSQIDENGQPLA